MIIKTQLRKALIAAAGLLALGQSAIAGSPAPAVSPTIEPSAISYNNFSVGYQYSGADLEYNFGRLNGNGFSLGGEVSPARNFYLASGFSRVAGEVAVPLYYDYFGGGRVVDVDVTLLNFNLGMGGYFELSNQVHFGAEFGFNYADLTGSLWGYGGSSDDFGAYITPHFRVRPTLPGPLEMHFGILYNSNDLSLSELMPFMRVIFEVCPAIDVFAGVSFGISKSDENLSGLTNGNVVNVNAGLRYNFD